MGFDPYSYISRPTLLLDETRTRENIHCMAEKARQQGVRFRPHFKTHQSQIIGEWFREEGVTAITVSSVEMAQYFAAAGWEDITIAFSLNLREMEALWSLARQVKLGLLVEDATTLHTLQKRLPAPVDLWIKIDSGLHRTGLAWDRPEDVANVLRQAVLGPHRLRGLLTHAGHTYHKPAAEVIETYQTSAGRMVALRDEMKIRGFGQLEVSVGDTPGCTLSPDLGKVDEIRPGNFVFFDAMQLHAGVCSANQIGVAVACPVVAVHSERNEVVVYGGAIHLSKDFFEDGGVKKYGYVALPAAGGWSDPLEGAYVSALSQEHGILKVRSEDLKFFEPGGLACILPAHSCLTVTCLGKYYTPEGECVPTMNTPVVEEEAPNPEAE